MYQAPRMIRLTSKQRAHLRSLANRLKPVVLVGADRVSETLLGSTLDAFNTRELLKVKAQEAAPAHIRDIATEIATRLEDVHVVQTIGRTAVLYRPHPDAPEIGLPKAGAPAIELPKAGGPAASAKDG